MTPSEFVMWLKGFSDLADPKKISKEEWQKIRNALSKVSVDNSQNESLYSSNYSSIYSNPTGRGILSCSLPTKVIGFK